MTATERLREDMIFNVTKNLSQRGFDAPFIAGIVELPLKKVQKIIQNIKNSQN